jgi:ankyrin repeat protein
MVAIFGRDWVIAVVRPSKRRILMQQDNSKLTDAEQAALERDQAMLDAINAIGANGANPIVDPLLGMIRLTTIEYWSPIDGDLATAKIKNEIAKGVDVNASSELGYTPLHAAAENNRIQNALILLQCGADIDALTDDGQSPMDFAILSGHAQMIQLLQKHKTGMRTNKPMDRSGGSAAS